MGSSEHIDYIWKLSGCEFFVIVVNLTIADGYGYGRTNKFKHAEIRRREKYGIFASPICCTVWKRQEVGCSRKIFLFSRLDNYRQLGHPLLWATVNVFQAADLLATESE